MCKSMDNHKEAYKRGIQNNSAGGRHRDFNHRGDRFCHFYSYKIYKGLVERLIKQIYDFLLSKMIFVVKATTNKEDQVLELILARVKKRNLNVYSLARPHGLRGYLLLEAENREVAEEASYDLSYVKGLLPKTLSYEEVKNMIEPVVAAINIEKGDIVEIIAEPFKKEKAKVIRVDKSKEEVIVELLEATVPIPITVKIDNVKVIRREKEEGEEK